MMTHMKNFKRAITDFLLAAALLIPQICFADELPIEPEEKGGTAIVPVIAALIIVAVIAIVIIKRRKK